MVEEWVAPRKVGPGSDDADYKDVKSSMRVERLLDHDSRYDLLTFDDTYCFFTNMPH